MDTKAAIYGTLCTCQNKWLPVPCINTEEEEEEGVSVWDMGHHVSATPHSLQHWSYSCNSANCGQYSQTQLSRSKIWVSTYSFFIQSLFNLGCVWKSLPVPDMYFQHTFTLVSGTRLTHRSSPFNWWSIMKEMLNIYFSFSFVCCICCPASR